MAELLLVYGLTIWQLPARYIRGLGDHFTADYPHSQTAVLPLCVFPQALITACFICILRQIVPFTLYSVDPSQSMVWHRKWWFLVNSYKSPSRDTFSNFPSQFRGNNAVHFTSTSIYPATTRAGNGRPGEASRVGRHGPQPSAAWDLADYFKFC